ncbi:MAG: DpnI domain-containing protein [Verrucomicrobiota bacterium]
MATWEVRDLLLIPSFMFSESAVIKRLVASKRSEDGKPLATTARRAGWVGCNIDLHRIAPEARIFIVRTIAPQSSAAVTAASHPDSSPGRRDACATLIATPEEVRENSSGSNR